MQGLTDSGMRCDARAIAGATGANSIGPNHDLPTWPRPVGQAGPPSRRCRFGAADAAGNRIGGPKPGAEAPTRQVQPVCTKRPWTTSRCATCRSHRTSAPPFAPAAGQARSQQHSLSPFVPTYVYCYDPVTALGAGGWMMIETRRQRGRALAQGKPAACARHSRAAARNTARPTSANEIGNCPECQELKPHPFAPAGAYVTLPAARSSTCTAWVAS